MVATFRVKVRQIKRRDELSALSSAKMQKIIIKKGGMVELQFQSGRESEKHVAAVSQGHGTEESALRKWNKTHFQHSCLTDEPTHKGKTEKVFLFLQLFYQSLLPKDRGQRKCHPAMS